jgi:hypothetical protein
MTKAANLISQSKRAIGYLQKNYCIRFTGTPSHPPQQKQQGLGLSDYLVASNR